MTRHARKPGGALRPRWVPAFLLMLMSTHLSAGVAQASPGGTFAASSPAWQAGTLAIDCPNSVIGGKTMIFTLSGSGTAIVDAGEGLFPAITPNTTFSPGMDGGATMTGSAPGEGSIELVWMAPDVTEARTVYLFATNEQGQTPGECAVTVQVASNSQENPSSADPEVGQSQAEANANATETAKPTSTPKPTRTPVPYDEVRGLPTTEIGPQLTIAAATGTATFTPTPTATVRQNATFAPTLADDGMVGATIGPDGGLLISPLGAKVEIPAGALKEPSTVTIIPVSDSNLPARSGVKLIPHSGFEITIAGPDGRAIDYSLLENATLTITISEDDVETGMRLYRVDGASLVSLPNTRIEGNSLSVAIDGFSRFAAGVSAATAAATNRNLLPFVLAAVVVLFAMIAMVILGGMFRPRRHRIITNRGTTRSRHR